MITKYLERFGSFYDTVDNLLITNEEGYIEYAAFRNDEKGTLENEGYTGKHLMDVYPNMTKEISSVFRVMKSGKPILDEFQERTDFKGNIWKLRCDTYPIIFGNRVIGAISGAVILDKNGKPRRRHTVSARSSAEKPRRLYRLDDIITRDKKMIRLKEQTLRVAIGDSPVMIVGDTGTGKELFAQSLHSHSHRAQQPFITQNCSAIPQGLLESTLFGTVRGSFTGAEDRRGLFELANGGTLFLDELNSMDIGLQGKILRAVEDKQIRRVGDEKLRDIDVRIISAMNCDADEALSKGSLRKDLFFRLGVIRLQLPTLAERRSDIPLLLDYFISHYNGISNKKIDGISDMARAVLLSYSWPGNVRELRNAIEFAFNIASDHLITINDLPPQFLDERHLPELKAAGTALSPARRSYKEQLDSGLSLTQIMTSYEREIIASACADARNTTEAARRLGISRQALRYKLAKYDLHCRGRE